MHRLTKTARIFGSGAAWLLAMVLLALMFVPDARAQAAPGELQCLPKQEGGIGTEAHQGWSYHGWWAWWWCPGATAEDPQRLTLMVGTPEVALRNLGDRVATVRNAADKLAAARASWRRHVTRPLSDPLFVDVLRDATAHIRATPNFGR